MDAIPISEEAENDAPSQPPHRPLEGLLVVDLSRYLPGPLVSRLLADLGARVLKLEEPATGDPVRQSIPRLEGGSALAALLLAGHESLAIDLKAEGASGVVQQLLSHADVLIESFRPGTLQRLGLAPADLRQRFPRLVICSVSGWGQEGPYAKRAGHDLTYQAVAGTLASRGETPAVQVADMVGSWSGATAILAALFRRQTSDEGCWIDQALVDAAAHANLTGWAGEADGPKSVGERLLLTGALPIYDLYATQDEGFLALGTLEPKFWRRFCKVIGQPELARLPLTATREETASQIAKVVAGRTRREWGELMAEHDLPVEVVLSCAEARAHPQMVHRELLKDAEDDLPRLGYPALFEGVRPRGRESVPALGQHTKELVQEFDLAPDGRLGWRRKSGLGRRISWRGWAWERVSGWFGKYRF